MYNVTALKKSDAGERLTAVQKMANMFDLDAVEFEKAIKKTICPSDMTNEQFVGFMIVAAEYHLNPLTKQIFPIKAKSGQILPVVSIDGWIRIINEHPMFDGMEFVDNCESGRLASITCRMFRKDRTRPTEVTEYLIECMNDKETWKKWPARMLRHKATIQSARYAFGLAGIYDPDEADRIGTIKDIDLETGEIKEEPKTDSRVEAAKDVLKRGNKPSPTGETIEGEARTVSDNVDQFEDARIAVRDATNTTDLTALMQSFSQNTRAAVYALFNERLTELKGAQ